jgi:hypothetical protein
LEDDSGQPGKNVCAQTNLRLQLEIRPAMLEVMVHCAFRGRQVIFSRERFRLNKKSMEYQISCEKNPISHQIREVDIGPVLVFRRVITQDFEF